MSARASEPISSMQSSFGSQQQHSVHFVQSTKAQQNIKTCNNNNNKNEQTNLETTTTQNIAYAWHVCVCTVNEIAQTDAAKSLSSDHYNESMTTPNLKLNLLLLSVQSYLIGQIHISLQSRSNDR